MTTKRQSRTWPYDLAKAIVALALLGLMLYLRPDMGATIQRQLGLPVGTVTVLDAPRATGNGTTTLSGSTQSGATVDVFAGDAKLGTTTAGADGSWSLPVALPPGKYQLRAQASDTAGAELGAPAMLEWASQQQPAAPSGAQASADSTQSTGAGSEIAPEATTEATVEAGTAAIADAATAEGILGAPVQASFGATKVTGDTVDFSGAGSPGSAVEVVAMQAAAGELVLGKALVGLDGLWNVTANISPGEYQIAVRTLDASGAAIEQSAGVALSVPAIGASEAETGSTVTEGTTEATAEGAAVEVPQMSAPVLSGDTAMLSGTAAAGSTVELVSEGRVLSKATADTDGLWVMAAQLEPGSYALQVRSRDTAGAQVTASRVVPLTVPAVSAAGAVTATVPADQVAARAAEGAPVESGASGAGAAASTTSPAANTPPTLGQPTVSGSTLTLSGTGVPGSTVEIVSGTTVLGKANVEADGQWSLASEVKPGDYKVRVVRKDAAGKVISQSPVVSVSIPATGAALELDKPQIGAGNTIALTGAGEPGATIEIVRDGAVVATTSVDDDGKWSYTVPAAEAGETAVAAQLRGQPKTRTKPVVVVVPVVLLPAPPASTPVAAPEATPEATPAGPSQGVAVAGAGNPGASGNSDGQAYIVLPGDSLSALAQEYLGDQARYPEIVAATNSMALQDPSFQQITDPNLIPVGQKIWIPAP